MGDRKRDSRAQVLSILNLGVFKNLHVLLRKRKNGNAKIQFQELHNGNLSIFMNIQYTKYSNEYFSESMPFSLGLKHPCFD